MAGIITGILFTSLYVVKITQTFLTKSDLLDINTSKGMGCTSI
jgi:hypothetical protein